MINPTEKDIGRAVLVQLCPDGPVFKGKISAFRQEGWIMIAFPNSEYDLPVRAVDLEWEKEDDAEDN